MTESIVETEAAPEAVADTAAEATETAESR